MASVAKRKWTYQGAQREAWVVRYKDKKGAHRSRQFDKKKDADAYCRQVENEIQSGVHVAHAVAPTLNQLAKSYVDYQEARMLERRPDLKEGWQVRKAMGPIARALGYYSDIIGNVKLTDLTWQDVEAATNALKVRKTVRGGKFASGTVRHALDVLTRAVGWAVRRGMVGTNVVLHARREMGPIASGVIDTFTRQEVAQILNAIEERPEKHSRHMQSLLRCMVYLAAFCGLRKGEILALSWASINLEAREVTVSASLGENDLLGPPKTEASNRTVPLPQIVIDALLAHQPYVRANDRGLLFRTIMGQYPGNVDFYQKRWGPLLERAGMPKTERGRRHFHALRHFAGSAWLDAGATLPEVSRLLGHADPLITAKIYVHSLRDTSHRRDMMDAIANGIKGLDYARDAQLMLTH